jgi:hypothetical protein
MKKNVRTLLTIIVLCLISSSNISAGPPFFTDDPEPVGFRHWEFYVASIMQLANYDVDATLPHLEMNYGLVTDVQVHLLAAMGYQKNGSGKQYGYKSTELGIKYRFINDEENGLQIGVFPLVEIPFGSSGINPGDEKLQVYLPLWFQKSWGKFTTYGGAGFWYNPGAENKNWIYTGWECQYDFSETITLGTEIYYHTPDTKGGPSDSGFNIGGFINLDSHNHILFSVGHTFNNSNSISGYFGYQFTI